MSYYNVIEIDTALLNLAAAFPAQAQAIDLPYLTAEGRRCRALHLSTAPGAKRDAVMIIGGVHADEWGSCEIVLNLASDLLKAYSAPSGLAYGPGGSKVYGSQQVHDLLDQRDLVLLPLVNPDGRQYCQDPTIGDDQWRKNRNPANSGGQADRIGVDINRNFDFVFDLANFEPTAPVSGSADPSNGHYQGPWANSEAETGNVVYLLDRFASTTWFVDLHSSGGVMHYAWHHDEWQDDRAEMNFRTRRVQHLMGTLGSNNYREFLATDDRVEMQRLAGRFTSDLADVRGTQYRTDSGIAWGPYPGTSHDYAYSRHLSDSSKRKVLGFTCEWGSIFHHPDWSDMEEIIEEVSAGLVGFCLATL